MTTYKFFGYISTISSWILLVWNAKVVYGWLNWQDLTNPIYQTQYTKLNLLNQILSLGTKSMKQNIWNGKNQIYQTKSIRKLNPPDQFYLTKSIETKMTEN